MNRILIIRLDGLGDTLLTLPLLTGLKTCWPACHITYIASPLGAGVFADDSRIDELWVESLAAMNRHQKWQLAGRIRGETFDAVICLNEKFWPTIWTACSGARFRLSFDPGRTQPLRALLRRSTLSHRLRSANDPSLVSIHEVERYAGLAALVGCRAAAGPMRFSLAAGAVDWARQLMAEQSAQIPVCLHLSPKWASEGWPVSTAAAVARQLLERFPALFLYVTAGPGEDRYWSGADELLPAGRFRLCNNLSLAEWAALLSQCRALVSMDTGAVHLAAAVNTPVVDVFPELNFLHASSRWAPWQVPHRIVRRPSAERTTEFMSEIQAALEALL